MMSLCTRPVPPELERRITEKGGKAPNGLPLFRVIWGADRLTLVGGEWNKYDDSGNIISTSLEEKLCVKYPMAETKWVFEMWCPPENYGDRQRWEQDTVIWKDGQRIQTLGPYPENGEYELLKIIETPNGHFVPLTSTICDAMVAVAVRNRNLPKNIRMAAFRDAQAKKEKEKEDHRNEIMANIARPSWATGDAYIIMPADVTKKGKVIFQ